MAKSSHGDFYLGFDFGTTSARASVIDGGSDVVMCVKCGYGQRPEDNYPQAWKSALNSLLHLIPHQIKAHIAGIAFAGTSATTLLVDQATGAQIAPPKLYNESQSEVSVAAAKAVAPPDNTATACTSALCKLITWDREGVWQRAQEEGKQPCLLHQADWLASLLHGDRSVTDWNNALKLGFDPETQAYPDWLTSQPYAHLLPKRVVAAGTRVGVITEEAAKTTGLPKDCIIASGTTDSVASFVASDETQPGQAVTSLGSTLTIKMLSTTRVDDARYGVYSHRLGDWWLVGGASNVGGAVLRAHFTDDQLKELTKQIDLSKPTGLQYYPLVTKGERFPVNDPSLAPCLEPRPKDDAVFLQGILESMARVEAEAYKLLYQLGARPALSEVQTAGGGAINEKWTAIRSIAIGVPVSAAHMGDASYGAAILSKRAITCSASS